ncbi:MAG: hypothetical protein R3236_04180 [Phycisphaeraceae bacterium]|nr:hypothetical protein [Phycisphaeraceae bacterium]
MTPTARVLILGLCLGGCQVPLGPGAGDLSIQSAHQDDAVLHGRYETAVYRYLSPTSVDVVMVEGSLENPTQALHLHLFWKPLAGRTPFDRHATNSTLRYMNFTGHGAGLYRGGGFLFPKTDLGLNVFEGELRHATLRLSEQTNHFDQRADGALLGDRVLVSGSFFARRDDRAVETLLRRLRLHFNAYLKRQRVSDKPATPAAGPVG